MTEEETELNEKIGVRLRGLRKSSRFTLEQLAEATGFTKSYLSKIENGKKVPPIASLAKIGKALGADLAFFFDEEEEGDTHGHDVCVIRASERKRVVRGGSSFGYDYQALADKKADKSMEPFIFTFPPQVNKDHFFEHEEEELFFVLSGRVAFEANGVDYILEPGDCMYIGPNVTHRGRSLGEIATALVVVARK